MVQNVMKFTDFIHNGLCIKIITSEHILFTVGEKATVLG